MAEMVVDVLEPIQIQEEQRTTRIVSQSLREDAPEVFLKVTKVVETGHRVVGGQLDQTVFPPFSAP